MSGLEGTSGQAKAPPSLGFTSPISALPAYTADCEALYYLKEKHGVIHRGVKPSNILLGRARPDPSFVTSASAAAWVSSKPKAEAPGCAAYMAVSRGTGGGGRNFGAPCLGPGLIHHPLPPPTCSPDASTPGSHEPDYDIRADVWAWASPW